MAWWIFGKKRRKSKDLSSPEQHKTILDEKRSALSSHNDRSRTISPTPGGLTSNPVDVGSTPYELQREGTPPILSDAPLKSLDRPIRTVSGSPKQSRKADSARHSRGPSAEVPKPPMLDPISPEPALDFRPSTPEPVSVDLLASSPPQSPEQVFQEAPQDLRSEETHDVTQGWPREPTQERHKAPSPEIPRTPEPQRITRRSSIEDITALPASRKTLERSPHLRPVPESEANVIAGTGRTRPGTARPSSRKKSVKRKEEDAIREEQVRAMSTAASPVLPVSSRRAGARSPELLKKDSQRMRDDLNKPLVDPSSVVSLPAKGTGSVRSSFVGLPESHHLNVGFMDILSPRPKVRYSFPGQPASAVPSRAPSRSEHRRETPKYSEETAKESRKIDELADEMDTRSIRELMERDQRRRQKKRKADEARARRRLEKYAARGKQEEEARLRGDVPAVPAMPATAPSDTASGAAGPSGVMRDYPTEIHPALRDTVPLPDQPETAEVGPDPFQDPKEEVDAPVIEEHIEDMEEKDEGPFADPPTTVEGDIERPNEEVPRTIVEDEKEDSSPVVEEVVLEPQAATSTAVMEDISEFQPETAESPRDIGAQELAIQEVSEPVDTAVTSSETEPPLQRGSGIAALFRRSLRKRDSVSRKSVAASEKSFTAPSREAAPKPQSSVEGLFVRTGTGTPTRTLSKFKEDLPGAATDPVPIPVAATDAPENESVPPLRSEPKDVPGTGVLPVEQAEPDSPAVPESLGSVDAEGSWLSGRPRKRTSQQMSIGRSSQLQPTLGVTSSTEDLSSEIATPSTEAYFTPSEETPHPFTSTGTSFDQALSLNQAAAEIVERRAPIVHSGTAQVVDREERVQSTHGLLQSFDDNENEDSELDSEDEDAFIEEATITPGVAQKASHARQISAGSAKILNIAPGEESTDVETATIGEGVTRQASHARQISAGSARLLDIASKRDSQPPPPTPPPPPSDT